MPSVQDVLVYIGTKVSSLTQNTLSVMNDAGIITSPTTAKLISILLILLVSWLVVHFFSGLKKPIKILIIGFSAILIISILLSFGKV